MNETESDAIQAYWKEIYHATFERLISSIKDRLSAELVIVFDEMERVLVEAITKSDQVISLNNVKRYYGTGTGKPNPPLSDNQLEEDSLKKELKILQREWNKLRVGRSPPTTYEDILNMVVESMKESSKDADGWWNDAPTRLMTWTRSTMREEMFDAIGILGWYKEELDDILDLKQIANDWVRSYGIGNRIGNFGNFTNDDLKIKDFHPSGVDKN